MMSFPLDQGIEAGGGGGGGCLRPAPPHLPSTHPHTHRLRLDVVAFCRTQSPTPCPLCGGAPPGSATPGPEILRDLSAHLEGTLQHVRSLLAPGSAGGACCPEGAPRGKEGEEPEVVRQEPGPSAMASPKVEQEAASASAGQALAAKAPELAQFASETLSALPSDAAAPGTPLSSDGRPPPLRREVFCGPACCSLLCCALCSGELCCAVL